MNFGGNVQFSLGLAQGVDNHGLPSASGPHNHGGVSRHHRLVHLNNFVHLCLHQNIAVFLENGLHGVIEGRIPYSRAVQPREQIVDQPQEKRHVFEYESRQKSAAYVIYLNIMKALCNFINIPSFEFPET